MVGIQSQRMWLTQNKQLIDGRITTFRRRIHILIVGGGYVALEKLSFIFKSSPESRVTIVSPMLREETASFIKGKKINYIQDKYKKSDLEKAHIVITTTDSPEVNQKVFADCREKNILVNVADSPSQCDFYMGSIVTKENLKIGISTNGKSQHLPSVCGNGWKTSYQNKSMIFSISYTFTARKSKGILSNKLKLLIK